jgi:hypothetical protein
MTEDRDAIALAERVLAILDEGRFTTTYKFALFMAILDLCIEKTDTKGVAPTTLTTRELALKVIESYWDHLSPYGEGKVVLRQSRGRQGEAKILVRILAARNAHSSSRADTLFRVQKQDSAGFEALVRDVEWKLIEMPIPRLQVLGNDDKDRFLYEYNWGKEVSKATVSAYQRHESSDFDNCLRLQPNVAENLVRLSGLLRPLFRQHWVLMVARMNGLPEAKLEEHLFRSERVPVNAVRGPLLEIQNGRCFYCEDLISGRADVDHFIPWARYSDNGLDNLVAAHPKCNNQKSDALAASVHVEHWAQRLRTRGTDLDRASCRAGWFRDPGRSVSVASALYLRLPLGTPLWLNSRKFEEIDRPRIAVALAGL